MTISTNQAIKAIIDYCGSNDLNLWTSDPTALPFENHYSHITVDIGDVTAGGAGLSGGIKTDTRRPIDWYVITGTYLGQIFTQSEGTLIEVLFDLNIFEPDDILELDEMYANGVEGYRSDGIRLPHNRIKKTR